MKKIRNSIKSQHHLKSSFPMLSPGLFCHINLLYYISCVVSPSWKIFDDIFHLLNFSMIIMDKEVPLGLPPLFFFFLRSYLRERESRSRGKRVKQTLRQAGSRAWSSVPEPWDHSLSRNQMLNWLTHKGVPGHVHFQKKWLDICQWKMLRRSSNKCF